MKTKISVIEMENPQRLNLILGQSHFIKTVEDIYEILITSVPGVKFGLAFCEASGDKLVRSDGNDQELIKLAEKNAMKIAAGHTFIIFLKDAYPINVLNQIKNCQEVCRIFCATSNPLQVIVAETSQGRGILGVIDGEKPVGIETEENKKERKEFLRKIMYKR
ncbi:MAG: adenosine-specific kinase [Candidatus Altiarchaeota archaeon]